MWLMMNMWLVVVRLVVMWWLMMVNNRLNWLGWIRCLLLTNPLCTHINQSTNQ